MPEPVAAIEVIEEPVEVKKPKAKRKRKAKAKKKEVEVVEATEA